jgi:VanZ family protein
VIIRWGPSLALGVGIVLLSVIPGESFPKLGISYADLAVHFAMYAVLAAAMSHGARWPCLTCWVIVTAACGALGGLLELVQHFVPGRATSLTDAVANLAGAAAGSAAHVRLRSWWASRGRAA